MTVDHVPQATREEEFEELALMPDPPVPRQNPTISWEVSFPVTLHTDWFKTTTQDVNALCEELVRRGTPLVQDCRGGPCNADVNVWLQATLQAPREGDTVHYDSIRAQATDAASDLFPLHAEVGGRNVTATLNHRWPEFVFSDPERAAAWQCKAGVQAFAECLRQIGPHLREEERRVLEEDVLAACADEGGKGGLP